MTSLASQEYWDWSYENLELVYDPKRILFKDLFNKYLKPNGTCFEVGCYPGNYLIYLGNQFNYEVNGIDTTPFILNRLPLHLKKNNVKVGNFYNENFLHFNPEIKYDLVCSFGFFEHFIDFETIIQRHVQLVKPSGILFITCPNFRKIQYIIHKYFDNENLKRHNLASMDVKKIVDVLQNNNMKVLYNGYYKTADFWVDSPNDGKLKNYASKNIQNILRLIDQHVSFPNPYTSPYIVCVAQKMDGSEL